MIPDLTPTPPARVSEAAGLQLQDLAVDGGVFYFGRVDAYTYELLVTIIYQRRRSPRHARNGYPTRESAQSQRLGAMLRSAEADGGWVVHRCISLGAKVECMIN